MKKAADPTNQQSGKKDIAIHPSWKRVLAAEFEKPYFADLTEFVRTEYLSKTVYPKPKDMFRAFDAAPFGEVKVVILGQDPYHGAGQANGLSFAVQSDMKLPPSLQNMFKEIRADFANSSDSAHSSDHTIVPRPDGDLSRWAEQGVLLLNSTLTVRAGSPGSHQNRGWGQFTDAAIRALSDDREHLVFMLWGNYAKQKGAHIDRSRHLVLEAAHPSPFSAHSGFFGCRHFSKANAYLREHGIPEIDWR